MSHLPSNFVVTQPAKLDRALPAATEMLARYVEAFGPNELYARELLRQVWRQPALSTLTCFVLKALGQGWANVWRPEDLVRELRAVDEGPVREVLVALCKAQVLRKVGPDKYELNLPT